MTGVGVGNFVHPNDAAPPHPLLQSKLSVKASLGGLLVAVGVESVRGSFEEINERSLKEGEVFGATHIISSRTNNSRQ